MADLNSAISVRHTRPKGERTGPRPLHVRVTTGQLNDICDLIRTGRATVLVAVQLHICTTPASIERSRNAGVQAVEKWEHGDPLTPEEQAAYDWHSAISSALAVSEIRLNRQALGDDKILVAVDKDGTAHYASSDPRHAANALKVLQLTRKHWRPVLEQSIQIQGNLTSMTDEELLAKSAALKAALNERE